MTVDTIAIRSVSLDEGSGGLRVEPVAGAPIMIPADTDIEIMGEVAWIWDVPTWVAGRLAQGVDVIISRSGDEMVCANFVAH